MAVSIDIQQKADNIRTAIKGKDVREALAYGIEDIDLIAEDTKSRQDTVEADFTSIQKSEAIRQSNENSRQQNEETRQTNEASRQNAENTRAENEETRQSNESIRQSNETTRQNTINAMKVLENYDNSKTYNQFNKVIYQDITYECIAENVTGVYPNSDASKWLCIAQKGQDGQGGDMFKSVYDTDKNGIVDNAERLGGQLPDYYVKANDFTSHLEDVTNNNVSALQIKTTDYSSFASTVDSNGIYTEVDYKRTDGTLYMKSNLLNLDLNGNYQTDTWQYYDSTGTTVILIKTWTIAYDKNGKATSKVVA